MSFKQYLHENKAKDLLKDWIEAFSKLGRTPMLEKYVFDHGKEFPQGEYTGKEKWPMKECFRNAILYCSTSGLDYVEGFAVTSELEMPIHHGWCTDGTKAIDPTWVKGSASYFGIQYKKDFAIKTILKKGESSLFLNKSMINIPFFKSQNSKWVEEFMKSRKK